MSSLIRRNKKHVRGMSLHMKCTLAKSQEAKQKLQLLCDDSSSPETDLKDVEKKTQQIAKRGRTKSNQSSETLSSSVEDNNIVHKSKKTKLSQKGNKKRFSSSDSEDSENDYDKQPVLSKEFTKSDKHKSNIKYKKSYSTVRKEKNKNKESECSDSETEVHEKGTEKKEKKHARSKSVSQNFISLFREEADSSSGKEFQSTKLSCGGSNIMKKLTQIKENYAKSNVESIKCAGKTTINEKQCLRFKSSVTKILNKFKEVCSEYELRMESVKWKHLKKELLYQESAKNIIDKSKNVIGKLKMKLDAQEKELVTFYNEWSQECNLRNNEDSSLSENEPLQECEEKPDETKSKESSQKDSVVSECDNEEIFSESEAEKTRVEEKEKHKRLIPESSSGKSADGDNENVSPIDKNDSPILGSTKTKKASNEVHSRSKLEVVDANEGNPISCLQSEDELINDSLEDIFEEIMIENIEATNTSELNQNELDKQNSSESKEANNESETMKCDPKKDESLLKNKEQSTESVNEDSSTEETKSTVAESLFSQETLRLKIDDTESSETFRIETSENNLVDELDDEEKAKKALLESDSESLLNEESPEKSTSVSIEDNLQQNCMLQPEEINSSEKKENETKTTSAHEDSLSNQQNEVDKPKICDEHTTSDLNSDSVCPSVKSISDKKQSDSDSSEDMRAKAKLLISSNSESSNSDDNNEVQVAKADFLEKQKREKDSRQNSSEDKNVESDFSISERVKKRRKNLKIKHNFKSEEKLKMNCHVVLERLPERSLKKYEDALSKSRQYLKDKKIDSLIDLDRLNRDSKKINDSYQSLSPKKKTKATKEVEDSLLDHLKRVENGDFNENLQEDPCSENSDPITKSQTTFTTKEELMMEADRVAKNILLNSDSDMETQKDGLESSSSEKGESVTKAKDRKKLLSKKEKKDSTSNTDDDEQEKSAWRRNKLLRMKLSSDSDSDLDEEKWEKKQQKLREKAEENNTENSDAKVASTKPKRRNFRKILDSDSEVQAINLDSNSDSSVVFEDDKSSDSTVGKKKTRKRKTRKSSNSDSSLPEKRSRQKRKRIKNMNTDSDSSNDSDNDITTNSQGTPGKKGRKNIRKVIKDKQVADDTKQAAKEEEERLKRIAERQKAYNEMYEARLAGEEKVNELVLDFNPETKEELLSVHTNLVKRLKPHQAKGIKFMWDCCFESLERINSSSGSGCIIAHCMGLGKTLQVITLTHTLLTCKKTGIKTIMVVCPLSTVLNWVNEFKLWLKDVEDGDDIEIYELTKLKKNIERKYQLKSWHRTGGVLIIGYEMFRNLSGTNNKMRKVVKEEVLQYLVDPGPDLIVCDEGHLLKNEDTALSKSMKRIKTLRRIVLTGTPLQNNLVEYHCMVQFVKPNLLGTKREFLNRFVNPITNGQFDDSTEYDVKIMKKRAYVLHKMLKGCVQRFDYSVLMPFLPPKQEYVIFVRLTDVQINMYRHYLDNFARRHRAASGSLFADFQALQRIWTHPTVLRLNAEKISKMNEKQFSCSESEGSLKDFINDNSNTDTETTTSSSDSDSDSVKSIESTVTSKRSAKRNNNSDAEIIPKPEENEKKEEEWWLQFIQPDHFEDMRISSKLVLLFSILKECEQIGDKVLVFSQSLYSLTLIEQFLEKIDNETQEGKYSEYTGQHSGSWSLGLDYFRLDGQTSAENRNIWCNIFNQPSNTRARLFLISTRAGGLGINLTAANRVIIFDASWNPSHDVQSIFRVYRFGQKKPCYVYRFLAAGTMEEKIYNRQVTKLSLACRVVDEQQIERHYSNHDLNELYNFDLYTNVQGEKPTLNLPKDRLLAEIFLKYKDLVETYHEHDSLLENKAEEELNEEERKQAWLEYEDEKQGIKPMPSYQMAQPLSTNMLLNQFNLPTSVNASMDFEKLKELIRKDYPNATLEQQQIMAARVVSDMYSYWEQQTYHNTANRIANQNAGISVRPTAMSTVIPTAMPTVIPTAMPTVIPAQMRMQVPNFARYPLTQSTNNMSGQIRNERPFSFADTDPKSGNADDDVVEVSPSITNKGKNQEE